MSATVVSYIGLGSNLNHPAQQIQQALIALDTLPYSSVLATSPFYITEPIGGVEQPDFINAVVSLSTRLLPHDLLSALHGIEQDFGRERLVHWGARTLDLDILLYGDQQINHVDLVIPHKEMPQRAFVLYPLSDIVPYDFIMPQWGALEKLLKACPKDAVKTL